VVDGLVTAIDTDPYDGPDWDDGPCCSICDGLGHGYPGGGPCPLEDRGYWDDPRGDWLIHRGWRL